MLIGNDGKSRTEKNRCHLFFSILRHISRGFVIRYIYTHYEHTTSPSYPMASPNKTNQSFCCCFGRSLPVNSIAKQYSHWHLLNEAETCGSTDVALLRILQSKSPDKLQTCQNLWTDAPRAKNAEQCGAISLRQSREITEVTCSPNLSEE